MKRRNIACFVLVTKSTSAYAQVHASTYNAIHAFKTTCTHAHTRTHTCTHTDTHTCTHAHTHTHTHAHTHTLTRICAHAHTHTHTHEHIPCIFTVTSLLDISPQNVSYMHEYRSPLNACCIELICSTSNTVVLVISVCPCKELP